MKNYDETINSVFSRIDEYNLFQKKRKQKIIKLTAILSFACLVVLIGVTIWYNPTTKDTNEQTINDALYPGIDDLIDNNTISNTDNKIAINKLESISDTLMDIALMRNDFVSMNDTQLKEYYGINVFPIVPSDLKGWDDQQFGIYKRDNGTGEIYHDVNCLNFSNDDFSRSVCIYLSKAHLPYLFCILGNDNMESSIINETEIKIGSTSDGLYYAEFMYCNVGFQVSTEGLSADELVQIINSITK